jgi:hypothetical protein
MSIMPNSRMAVEGHCRKSQEFIQIDPGYSLDRRLPEPAIRQNRVYTDGIIYFTLSPSLPVVPERSTSIS